MRDLFGHVPPAPKSKPKPTGHAWNPGSGPADQVCKTCAHFVTLHLTRTTTRCGLMRKRWAQMPRPEIKPGDAACFKWKAKGPRSSPRGPDA